MTMFFLELRWKPLYGQNALSRVITVYEFEGELELDESRSAGNVG